MCGGLLRQNDLCLDFLAFPGVINFWEGRTLGMETNRSAHSFHYNTHIGNRWAPCSPAEQGSEFQSWLTVFFAGLRPRSRSTTARGSGSTRASTARGSASRRTATASSRRPWTSTRSSNLPQTTSEALCSWADGAKYERNPQKFLLLGVFAVIGKEGKLTLFHQVLHFQMNICNRKRVQNYTGTQQKSAMNHESKQWKVPQIVCVMHHSHWTSDHQTGWSTTFQRCLGWSQSKWLSWSCTTLLHKVWTTSNRSEWGPIFHGEIKEGIL